MLCDSSCKKQLFLNPLKGHCNFLSALEQINREEFSDLCNAISLKFDKADEVSCNVHFYIMILKAYVVVSYSVCRGMCFTMNAGLYFVDLL